MIPQATMIRQAVPSVTSSVQIQQHQSQIRRANAADPASLAEASWPDACQLFSGFGPQLWHGSKVEM
jgi:hypothetical protein